LSRDLKNYLMFEFFVSSLTPMSSTLEQANAYTDTEVSGAIAECKQYTDDAIAILDTKINETTADVLQDANTYTDTKISEIREEISNVTLDIDVNNIYTTTKLQAYSDYLNAEVADIKTKLNAIAAQNKCNLAFVTDVHAYTLLMAKMDVEKAIKNSVYALNEINRDYKIHGCINNGDLITSGGKKETVLNKLKDICSYYKNADMQVLMIKGNHDDSGYGNEERPAHVLYDTERHQNSVGVFYNQSIVYDTSNAEKSYYYYDIEDYKIRVICINTCDFNLDYINSAWLSSFGTSGISNSQLNFIANALNFNESGWSIIVAGHHCLRRTSNMGTTNSGINVANNGDVLWNILKAFKNKTAYSSYASDKGFYNHNVSVDYTNNMSDDVICCLSGHTHSDNIDIVDNIRLISVDSGSTERGEGRIPLSDLETSIDILTINKSDRVINATRYGYGIDREIAY